MNRHSLIISIKLRNLYIHNSVETLTPTPQAMDQQKLQQLIRWLNEQINTANVTINEAQRTQNYGRLVIYEGMRDAYVRCLSKLGA